jgi:predicted MFS family arabinose efflux permease
MASVAATLDRPLFSVGYRRWMLALLVAIYACSFIDRVIVATVGQAIKVDLRLSDTQFGMLTGPAFALFYVLFGMPVAWLAERFNRINIIALSVALWSAMTVLCGTALGYPQLLLYRMGVGVGEGGAGPAAQSLLSDHYPARQRATALAVYMIGVPLGTMLGAVAGGWLTQAFDWRTAFTVVGLPGLGLAVLARLTLREPPRGLSELADPAEKAPGLGATLRRLNSTSTFRFMAAGCVLTNLAGTGISQFTPTFLARTFALRPAEVGLLYGLVYGLAGTFGILASGFGSDLGARRDKRWYAWLPAGGAALALPSYLLAFTRADAISAAACIFAGALCMAIYMAPTFAVLQNLVEPRMRATAAALMLLLMNVFGQGVGPALIGLESDAIARRLFTGGDYAVLCRGGIAAKGAAPALAKACVSASALGLKYAILASVVFLVLGTGMYLMASRVIRRDLKT